MYNVHNLIKLAGILVMVMAYMVGLGWLLIGPLLHGSLVKRKSPILLAQELPLILVAGFIVNFGILLILQSLTLSLILGACIATIGCVTYGLYFIRSHLNKLRHPDSENRWILAGFMGLLLISPTLTTPLIDWDARSIWFFHAKMMYYAGSIGLSAGWQDPSVFFSHVDYPKLIPSLAAQVMLLVGYWNEFLPKISIFIILIPAIIWLVSFLRRSISSAFLVVLLPFSLQPWLWNGYMDGILTFYFCIALLLFSRYLVSADHTDLISSGMCAIQLLYIKNEGELAALALVFSALVMLAFRKRIFGLVRGIKIPSKLLLIGTSLLIPFIIWQIYKERWGLTNDLGLGTGGSFDRLSSRLLDNSLGMIIDSFYTVLNPSLILLGIMLISLLMFRRPMIKGSVYAITASLIFIIGLSAVYMMSPHDLAWHLSNSAARVLELSIAGFNIGSYLILDALEHDPVVLEPKPIRHI